MISIGWSPVIGYLAAGIIKFMIHCLRQKRLAFDEIGLGGFPSTHTTVIATPLSCIAWRTGFDSSTFAIGLALLMIVVIDAMDLRRRIGQHASILNQMAEKPKTLLRIRIGHRWHEVCGGIFLSIALGWLMG